MSSVGYHEPDEELSDATRDMHRAIVSLMEKLEAVDWYNPRAYACKDAAFSKELKDYLVTDEDIAPKWSGASAVFASADGYGRLEMKRKPTPQARCGAVGQIRERRTPKSFTLVCGSHYN